MVDLDSHALSFMYPSDIEIAYTAGIIDGEGCIRMQKNRGIYLAVGNTSLDLLVWLRDRWGGKIYDSIAHLKLPNSKRFYQWQLHGKHALFVVEKIAPFLIIKQKQALKVLELKSVIGRRDNYHPERTAPWRAKRKEVYDALKVLNRRGLKPPNEEMSVQ